jgi:hypothetical protein
MKKVRYLIIKTCGILLAALFLTGGCAAAQPVDQTAELPGAQSAAPDASGEKEPAERQTEPPAPTATPTLRTPDPTPTATPSPVSDEALQSGALDSFFNDSVLIGDSMTAGFSHYVLAQREDGGVCLGNMKCIGQSGLFLKHAYQMEIGERSPVLPYRGRNYCVSDLVQTLGTKTLYLLLGVNDAYVFQSTVEEELLCFDEIIRKTREKSPGVQIVLITIPPVLKSYARDYACDPHFNVDVNEALYRYCEENGFGVVELAARLRDEDGYLDRTCCSDDKFHLNQDGDALWLAALREYARTQYETGAWTPEEAAD